MDKILVIQDSPSVNMLLSMRLEAAGFSVDIAETGEEGVEKAKKNQYQLVLLDYTLPGMNGAQVCRILKKENSTRKTPVLFMSAKDKDELTQIVRDTQADGYVDVLFESNEFIGQLRGAIDSGKD